MQNGGLNLWVATVLIVVAWAIFLVIAFMTRKTMGNDRTAAEICLLCMILIGIIIGSPVLWIIKLLLALPVFIVGVVLIAFVYQKKHEN